MTSSLQEASSLRATLGDKTFTKQIVTHRKPWPSPSDHQHTFNCLLVQGQWIRLSRYVGTVSASCKLHDSTGACTKFIWQNLGISEQEVGLQNKHHVGSCSSRCFEDYKLPKLSIQHTIFSPKKCVLDWKWVAILLLLNLVQVTHEAWLPRPTLHLSFMMRLLTPCSDFACGVAKLPQSNLLLSSKKIGQPTQTLKKGWSFIKHAMMQDLPQLLVKEQCRYRRCEIDAWTFVHDEKLCGPLLAVAICRCLR